MSPLEKLLPLLRGVKRTGPDRYIAFSTTRDERTPSLTVRELPDGRVLIHDFGGDGVDEVLAAIGLTTSDLFPTKLTGSAPMRRRGLLSAGQALGVLEFEAALVRLAAQNLAGGHALTEADRERLAVAAARVAALHDEVRA